MPNCSTHTNTYTEVAGKTDTRFEMHRNPMVGSVQMLCNLWNGNT